VNKVFFEGFDHSLSERQQKLWLHKRNYEVFGRVSRKNTQDIEEGSI